MKQTQAGAADMGDCGGIDCAAFMSCHGEYADGLLDVRLAARLRAHVGACAACARYDRVVRRALELVEELPVVEPSPDFEQRLQHRLFHIDDGDVLGPRPAAGAAAALALAAAVALLAWSPVLVQDRTGTRTAVETAVVPAAFRAAGFDAAVPGMPAPMRGSFAGGVFTTAPGWYSTGSIPATGLATFPGPYSPLVVTPPAYRAVRTISSGYTPRVE